MKHRSGFTLIELLVVIATIAVLVALLLPAVQAAREAARATQCRNNLKQLALAMHVYHDRTNVLPPGWTATPLSRRQGWGWGAMLLPDLGQPALFQRLQFSDLMTSATNLPLLAHSLDTFVCPTNTYPRTATVIVQEPEIQPFDLQTALLHPPPPKLYTMAKSDYAGVSGNTDLTPQPDQSTGLLFRNSSVRFRDITDGTSQTLLVGERRVSELVRRDLSGVDLTYIDLTVWSGVLPWCSEPLWRVVGTCRQTPGNTSRGFPGFASQHPGSTLFALADGSVRRISSNIDLNTYQALSTRAGGEIASEF